MKKRCKAQERGRSECSVQSQAGIFKGARP